MTELEMTTEAETEEFTDELSDEALDREPAGEGGGVRASRCGCFCGNCRAGN